MAPVDAQDRLEKHRPVALRRLVPGNLLGLRGRLARPFWGLLTIWAVLCGALASDQVAEAPEALLTLALALLLAEVAWGGLWDLATSGSWFRSLAEDWPAAPPASWRGLPYTQPGSPAGRIVRGLNRLAGWWRAFFWPEAGSALLGGVAAALLAVVLALLLPDRLRLLYAALTALVGLGLARAWRRKDLLAGQALLQAGLGWLAGHLAFAEMRAASLALALGFAAAALGSFRLEAGQRRGLWLLNAGQGAVAALLVALEEPLAAGAIGLLLLAQVAQQPALRLGTDPARIARRTWPWLMAAMLAAAVALP